MTERANRIMTSIIDSENIQISSKDVSKVILAIVHDFPKFRTSEKPNEWELGYYTAIQALVDISYEISNI